MAKSWTRRYPREAKYAGWCSLCGQKFSSVTRIAWKPGLPAQHWDCYLNGIKGEDSKERDPAWERRFTTGAGSRSISERAQRDQETVKRTLERLGKT